MRLSGDPGPHSCFQSFDWRTIILTKKLDDDEATMQRVIDLGVDGIISDDPDLLLLVAKRNGLA